MSQTLPVSLNTASIPVANDHTSRLPGWLVGILALWLMLLVWSFVRTPIPAVNEPHYMTKARHFWNPEWCDRDFFLSSSNPHLFYYVTVGWLTNFCSLHMATLISRLFGLRWRCFYSFRPVSIFPESGSSAALNPKSFPMDLASGESDLCSESSPYGREFCSDFRSPIIP